MLGFAEDPATGKLVALDELSADAPRAAAADGADALHRNSAVAAAAESMDAAQCYHFVRRHAVAAVAAHVRAVGRVPAHGSHLDTLMHANGVNLALMPLVRDDAASPSALRDVLAVQIATRALACVMWSRAAAHEPAAEGEAGAARADSVAQFCTDALGAWEKTYDEASGKTYFYNPHLEQTTWVRPRDLDSPPLEFDVRGDASADEFELVGGIPNAGSGVTFGEGGRRCSYADFEALRRGASIAQALPPNNAGAEQFPGELAIRLAVWVRETLLKRQALTLAAQDALRVFLGLNERWNGAAGTAEIVLDGVKKLYLWPVCASKGAAQ